MAEGFVSCIEHKNDHTKCEEIDYMALVGLSVQDLRSHVVLSPQLCATKAIPLATL
jgi:hypothetical protein